MSKWPDCRDRANIEWREKVQELIDDLYEGDAWGRLEKAEERIEALEGWYEACVMDESHPVIQAFEHSVFERFKEITKRLIGLEDNAHCPDFPQEPPKGEWVCTNCNHKPPYKAPLRKDWIPRYCFGCDAMTPTIEWREQPQPEKPDEPEKCPVCGMRDWDADGNCSLCGYIPEKPDEYSYKSRFLNEWPPKEPECHDEAGTGHIVDDGKCVHVWRPYADDGAGLGSHCVRCGAFPYELGGELNPGEPEDMWWCLVCHTFRDENHQCEQWSKLVHIPKDAIIAWNRRADSEEVLRLRAALEEAHHTEKAQAELSGILSGNDAKEIAKLKAELKSTGAHYDFQLSQVGIAQDEISRLKTEFVRYKEMERRLRDDCGSIQRAYPHAFDSILAALDTEEEPDDTRDSADTD